MSIELEIQLVAVVVAMACSLAGVFLVLRRLALMSDAISHTVLLGIVLVFFITRDISSPLLVFGAALMGVATVGLVELLRRTRQCVPDGARLLLADFWTDVTHTQTTFAALMAGEFLVITGEGDVYSEEEAHGWLKATGWRPLRGCCKN